MALGSRLMNAFYTDKVLKEIVRHDVALHHNITAVLADGGHDSSTVVRIVAKPHNNDMRTVCQRAQDCGTRAGIARS